MKEKVIFHKEFEGARFPERGSDGAAGMDFFIPKPTSSEDPCFEYIRKKCIDAIDNQEHRSSINSIFDNLLRTLSPEAAFIGVVYHYNRWVFGNKHIEYEIPSNGEPVLLIEPNTSVSIPSGLSVDLPHGYALDFRNKSGIASKKNLVVGAELVDEDYTGVMHIDLHNIGSSDVRLSCGMKVAQAVLEKTYYDDLEIICSDERTERKTSRGEGGFGSTGMF